jgi:IS5 family transposase
MVMRVIKDIEKKRADAQTDVTWHVAMRPGKSKALNIENEADAMIDKTEKFKAGLRAKVEHPFRVIKRQLGFAKVRYRGLRKNTDQLVTLFALRVSRILCKRRLIPCDILCVMSRFTPLPLALVHQHARFET